MRIEDVTWAASEPGPFSGGIIYEPLRPRWWWCRYLPETWRWAWRGGPIAYIGPADSASDSQP